MNGIQTKIIYNTETNLIKGLIVFREDLDNEVLKYFGGYMQNKKLVITGYGIDDRTKNIEEIIFSIEDDNDKL